MRSTTRRTWMTGLGGVALTHLVGCASQSSAIVVGRSLASDRLSRDAGVATSSKDGVATQTASPAAPITKTSPSLPLAPPELDLPPRAAGAETGSAFIARLEGLGRAAIDEEVVTAVAAGNVPAFERRFVPIELASEDGRRARIFVTVDYLAIGSNDDFIRMPMTSAAAQRIADLVDASLPTRRIVDAIYDQAPSKLPPSFIDGGPTEGTLRDFSQHQATLEERRKARGFALGTLTAGDKKDLVLSRRMLERADHVIIYGWHRKSGDPIQPLSNAHSCRYADYSHGVRLVFEDMTIDGKPYRVSDVLCDPELADLLSDEGTLPMVAYSTVLPEYTGRVSSRSRGARASRR